MTKDQIYEIWSPEASPWSRWVKPVLFSFLREQEQDTVNYSVPGWAVPLAKGTAIVADLPGAEGVVAGIVLCHAGYRPIPVYNACPWATYDPYSDVLASLLPAVPAFAVVDVLPIMAALGGTVEELAAAHLPASAPPVFLLDSNRRGKMLWSYAGCFDNRSYVTTTDFPSADFLQQQGISQVVLVQTRANIQADLLAVLLVWQRDGLKIARQAPWAAWEPRSMTVKRPPVMIYLWEWLRRAMGYRRNASGAFGEVRSGSG